MMLLPRHAARLALAATLVVTLAACRQDSPPPAPANFAGFAGDNTVTLTWDQEPGKIYYLYLGQGTDANQDNILGLPESKLVSRATSPFSFAVASNDLNYVSLIVATQGTSKGGAAKKVYLTPRQAGMSFTQAVPPSSVNANLLDIAFGLNQFVAVTSDNKLVSAKGPQAPDGQLAPITLPAFTGSLARTVFMTSPTTRFLALGTGQMLFSADAVTWSTLTPTFMSTAGTTLAAPVFNAVTQVGGTTVAVGDAGAIFSSTDGGQSWVSRGATNVTQSLRAVAFVLGRYVVAGDGGALYWSSDLVTWTDFKPAALTSPLRALAGTATSAVAVGDGGTILYLTLNATSGAPQVVDQTTAAITSDFSAAVQGARFILASKQGTFAYSNLDSNGVVTGWTSVTPTLNSGVTATPAQNALAYAYGRVLSVGDAGSRFVSPTAAKSSGL